MDPTSHPLVDKHPLVQSWLENTNVGPLLSPFVTPSPSSSLLSTPKENKNNESKRRTKNGLVPLNQDSNTEYVPFFAEEHFEKYSISSLSRRMSNIACHLFRPPPSSSSSSSSSSLSPSNSTSSLNNTVSTTSDSISVSPLKKVKKRLEKEVGKKEKDEMELDNELNSILSSSAISTPSISSSTNEKSNNITNEKNNEINSSFHFNANHKPSTSLLIAPKVKKSVTQLLPIEMPAKKQKIEKEGNQLSPLEDMESHPPLPLLSTKPPPPSSSSFVASNAVLPPLEEIQKYSILSGEEHLQFLNLQKKVMAALQRSQGKLPLEGVSSTDLQLYDYLLSFVSNEQQKWREWKTRSTLTDKSFLHKVKFVLPPVDSELEKYFEKKRELVKEYPSCWSIRSVFDLRSIQISANDPVLKHKQTILQKGKCLHFQPPSRHTELPCSFSLLSSDENRYPWKKKIFPSVSKDENVVKLLEKWKADFVISSSTLSALVDTSHSFEIPVTISSTVKDGTTQKTIYLDKPLLSKKMTPKEKNSLYFKVALKSIGLQSPSTHPSIDFDIKQDESLGEESMENDNVTYNLWQFGSFSVLIRCKLHGKISDNTAVKFRYVGLGAKMEYQLGEGFEEITPQETAKSWIYTFIRPDAHFILARINPENGVVVEIEHRDMPSILPPGSPFKPEVPSKFIFSVFQQLQSLEDGKYLISHKSNEFNVVIFQSVPTDTDNQQPKLSYDYDLHSAHKSSPITDLETLPFSLVKWDSVTHPDQIPCTFPLNRVATPKLTLLCFNFLHKGSCEIENCGKIHANLMQLNSTGLPLLKEKQQFGVGHCHFFASFGFCKQPTCKHPHVPKSILQSQKKKGKKKRFKDKVKKDRSSSVAEEDTNSFSNANDLSFIASNI